jgi:hypothetical protein
MANPEPRPDPDSGPGFRTLSGIPVDGVYARQLPRDDCDPLLAERLRRWSATREKPERKRLVPGDPPASIEAFEALHLVRSPSAVMAGRHTDLDPSWFAAQADALGVDLQLVEGGHFCLFEDTDRAVRLVGGNLRALGYLT